MESVVLLAVSFLKHKAECGAEALNLVISFDPFHSPLNTKVYENPKKYFCFSLKC